MKNIRNIKKLAFISIVLTFLLLILLSLYLHPRVVADNSEPAVASGQLVAYQLREYTR